MKRSLLCFSIFVAASALAFADAVNFQATVNASTVSLDEALQLTLTVSGVNQDIEPINLPALDGFSAKYLGPSTSVSIINGDYHSERSFIYNLFPNKVGHFQIPSISATIAGQTYTTKPIDVEVTASAPPSQQASASTQTDQNQAPTAESLKDKILTIVSVPKTNVYVNEKVPVSIKLLVNGVPMRDIQYPQFDKTGFMADDFDQPQQGSQVVNGINYDTVEFKTNVYPSRTGDLSIGPVQIAGNIVYKTGQASPFMGDSGFGPDIFNNFFNTYTTRAITINSQPVVLHVAQLPEDSRPSDFSGAIGHFDFTASVSPIQVKAGDPITLKMDIKGSGNFKSAHIPVFQAAGFKAYEPQVKDTGDEKTADEVIIPTSTGITAVPALRFSYFDTDAGVYKTIMQGPFPIQVTAPSPDQEFKAVGFADISREPVVSMHRFSWGKEFGRIFHFLKALCSSVLFWAAFAAATVAAFVYWMWRRFQQRLENDPAFARRLKAVREAKQALNPAQKYIAAGETKEFYALLSKVLREYLANKWHQSSAALISLDEILGQLKAAKANDALVTQVKNLLEYSDLVCFAGVTADANKMRADLAQTQELILSLEKSLR